MPDCSETAQVGRLLKGPWSFLEIFRPINSMSFVATSQKALLLSCLHTVLPIVCNDIFLGMDQEYCTVKSSVNV